MSPTITLVASTQYQSYTELLPGSSGSKVFNLRGWQQMFMGVLSSHWTYWGKEGVLDCNAGGVSQQVGARIDSSTFQEEYKHTASVQSLLLLLRLV